MIGSAFMLRSIPSDKKKTPLWGLALLRLVRNVLQCGLLLLTALAAQEIPELRLDHARAVLQAVRRREVAHFIARDAEGVHERGAPPRNFGGGEGRQPMGPRLAAVRDAADEKRPFADVSCRRHGLGFLVAVGPELN